MKHTDWLLMILAAASPGWLLAGPRGDDVTPASVAPAAPVAPAETPAPTASTVPVKPAPEAAIHFANSGGIWDWDVVDSSTLLIQDRSRRWYKAKLLGNCYDLPFEQKIGFESNANGDFDKFSAIQTRQQRCPLISLTRTHAPAKKLKKGDSNAKREPTLIPPPATQSTTPLS